MQFDLTTAQPHGPTGGLNFPSSVCPKKAILSTIMACCDGVYRSAVELLLKAAQTPRAIPNPLV
jgi:hypothetical protein